MNRRSTKLAKAIATVAAGALLYGAVSASAAPAQVWEDPAGDAGLAYFEQPVPGADQAGFDLVSGSIAKVKKNLEFTVTHSQMPPFGTLPEVVRFLWGFAVDGTSYRLTVKSVDVGKPNPATGTGADRIGQVDNPFFRLEGDCGSTSLGAVSLIECPPIEYLEGSFDPASKSFTVIIPMKLVKAKPGSKITVGGGDATTLCQICWISHVAERSSDRTLIDAAVMTSTYKVPKK